MALGSGLGTRDLGLGTRENLTTDEGRLPVESARAEFYPEGGTAVCLENGRATHRRAERRSAQAERRSALQPAGMSDCLRGVPIASLRNGAGFR
jgi:hypothetical protein